METNKLEKILEIEEGMVYYTNTTKKIKNTVNSNSNSESESESESKSNSESESESKSNSESELGEENLLTKIDQKIILKFMREGKTSRTYIIGIHNYFKKEEELNTFIKSLKKKLGTSLFEKTVDYISHYGFAGNHIDKIYEELIKNNIAKKHEIKKQ